MLRYLTGALALAMALACASTPALAADNMTVKDAAGTVQIVCTKEDASLVDHPCHVMEGIYNGQPVKMKVAADGSLSIVNDSLTALAASNIAYGGVTDMPSAGVAYAAGRSLQLECSVAGSVKLTFADASVRTIPVQPGLSILPYVVTAWSLSGVSSPATCTYANLK